MANEIVVGVDGSDGSRAALRFAAEEAALRGAHLRIVSAWQTPAPVFGGGFPLLTIGPEAFRAAAESIVGEAVEEARELQPGVACDGAAVEGQAAHVLAREAANATLLVVGARGHGGFAYLLLGSISQQVAHHTPCPVAIVPRG